jgi:hypothetical protein
MNLTGKEPSTGQTHAWPGQFDDFQAHPLFLRGWCRLLARGALIPESQFHALSCHFLHGRSQFAHLSPILLIGRGEMQGQQISQGIERNQRLRSTRAEKEVVCFS